MNKIIEAVNKITDQFVTAYDEYAKLANLRAEQTERRALVAQYAAIRMQKVKADKLTGKEMAITNAKEYIFEDAEYLKLHEEIRHTDLAKATAWARAESLRIRALAMAGQSLDGVAGEE